MTTKRVTVALLSLLMAISARAETAAPPADAAVGKKVPKFTAKILDFAADPPRLADFDSTKVKKPTAYIFVGTTCPATNAYADRFSELVRDYTPKGIDFVFLYPNSNDTAQAKVDFHKQKNLRGRVIDDQGASIAKLFGAQRTTEIFLAKGDGTVVYHGPVDDSREVANVKQHYLTDALKELQAHKPITVASAAVFA
ncbi:MAG TPA: redoxin family protein [Candidatus Acidoferrales bacterium]|nr:redoxin family protein [Candidatus Acidoferrales bacterium]